MHMEILWDTNAAPREYRAIQSGRSVYVTLRGATYLRSEDGRTKSAGAPLFHPMPALLCLPGERTPCEREEMRCKGQRVPIRATALSPICAQFMPLCCCGLRGSPPAAPTPARRQFFQRAPRPFALFPLSPSLRLNKNLIRRCN